MTRRKRWRDALGDSDQTGTGEGGRMTTGSGRRSRWRLVEVVLHSAASLGDSGTADFVDLEIILDDRRAVVVLIRRNRELTMFGDDGIFVDR